MTKQFNEEITKAAQTVSMLAGEIQAAHRLACYAPTENGARFAEILLLDAIADARKLADRLKLIQDAAGSEVQS